MSPGIAASEDEVPSWMKISSLMWRITFQNRKPAARATPPSTSTMNNAHVI